MLSESSEFMIGTYVATITTVLVIALYYSINLLRPVSQPSCGIQNVPLLPGSIPLLGHLVRFLLHPTITLSTSNPFAKQGIYALKLGTSTYNIVSNPGLIKSLHLQSEDTIVHESIETILHMDRTNQCKLDSIARRCWDELNVLGAKHMTSEVHVDRMLETIVREAQQKIPSMVSFVDSHIDQEPWERLSSCTLLSPNIAEFSLLPFLNEIVGTIFVDSIYGKALLENYPNLLQDTLTYSKGRMWLLSELPRWTPIPRITTTHTARKKVKDAIMDYLTSYDGYLAGETMTAKWADMDDVSTFLRERMLILQRHDLPSRDLAEFPILVDWTLGTILSVFWSLVHILSIDGLVDRIRKELVPYVRHNRPACVKGISDAQTISFSTNRLSIKCSSLRKCYLEVSRLHNRSLLYRSVVQDTVLTDQDLEAGAPLYKLEKGDRVIVVQGQGLEDDLYPYDTAREVPSRQLLRSNTEELSAEDIDTTNQSSDNVDPNRHQNSMLEMETCGMVVASILILYDIGHTSKEQVSRSTSHTADGWSLPTRDVRIRISRRTVPALLGPEPYA